MGINQGATKRLFLFVTPLLTGWCVATSPTLAATLASSEARVNLENFSHNPLGVETFTDTDTQAIATSGQVTADADANALFITDGLDLPTQAYNTSFSTVQGEGSGYFGLAQSLAAVIGYNFMVGANETFSFDFAAFLGLRTSIDSPKFEQAKAEGDISLQLFDTTDSNNWRPLDFLSVSGKLVSLGEGDFLDANESASITFNPNTTYLDRSFGGNQELATASVEGKFSRTFDSLTYLTLVETKTNRAIVQPVPESSNLVALLFFCLISVGYGVKRFAIP
jgi:hypothetical protein